MAFNLPVQNFFTRIVQPDSYVRPLDWPVITDAANEVQFLMSDINDASCTIRTQFTRTSGAQDIIIDWGDGTTNTVSAIGQTDTTHQYIVGTGTPCSRGYTTFKIRVYFTGTGVSVMNVCRLFSVLIAGNSSSPYTNVGLLEIYYGDGTQTVQPNSYYLSSSSTGVGNFSFLEYAKLPSTVTWIAISSMFENCISLAVVVMPTSASSLSNIASIFSGCLNLRTLTLPSNAVLINSMQNVFNNCVSLSSVTFPTSMNSCTSFSNTFTNCSSLKNITIPSVNVCTGFATAFNNCYSLEWVRFSSLPTFGSSTAVSFVSTFAGCFNLQNVYFPATCSANANYDLSNTFSNCWNLKSIVFPSGFNPSTLSNTFSNCANLRRVVFQSAASNLTSLSNAFQSCYYLTDLTLPSSVSSSGVTLANMLNNCYALKTITIPNTYLVTSLANAFANCFSLQTLTWTPGVQNSLTSMNAAFSGCFLLKSFTMPTSMTALTDMSSAFSTCRSITTLSFPASLNAVTTMASAFASMSLLTSITLPTSMSACTIFSSTFSSSFNIRTITMPATVSASTTTFASCFAGCASLYTVTLPSVNQLSLVTSIQAMFNNCSNLNTINNLNKIGSLTATPLVIASGNIFMRIPSISFSMPISLLALNNTSSGANNNVQAVRLLNTSAGQWTGASPQINVSYTNMSTAALVQLFNDMAAQGAVVSKTINITASTGAAGLTAANRLIITSLGWTITG